MTFAPSRRACAALAVAAYLIVALVALRNALASPSTLLPYPTTINARVQYLLLDHFDQAMVVATITRNAKLLVESPWELFADVGQCYPMPAAYTLGEHMFGVSFLAALPYAITHDPIFSYNVALIFTLWIPGVTMYFLSLRFTRSPAAAFVAGLAFVLVPGRLIDPSHPYVHGDLWAPAVLLFLHRLFVSARWRDALGLALFLNLEVAESLYPLLSTCLIAGTYGLYLLVRHRANLPRVLPRLLASLALALVGVWVVLVPYLETSATWGLLAGRASTLLHPGDFLWGGEYFPGFGVSALVAVALLDRLRGPRLVHGEDPRLIFTAAGLLIAWSALADTVVPGIGIAIESPFLMLRGIVPGLEAVRALASVAIGTGIATSFLCGFGVLALVERLRPRPWAPIAGALLCALVLGALRFVPSLAAATFGRTFQFTTYEARPPQEDIDLIRAAGRGPTVDYPLGSWDGRSKRLDVAESLLLASYDPRPMAACYNSFLSPVNEQMMLLSTRIPAPESLDALGALGFETVLLTRRRLSAGPSESFYEAVSNDAEVRRRLSLLGETQKLQAYRITARPSVDGSFDLLVPGPLGDVAEAIIPSAHLEFPITNPGPRTFRHPEPLRPSRIVVRWEQPEGTVVREDETTALLPIALGPGGTLPVTIDTPTPDAPGTYGVTLARADRPDRVIARRRVRVPPLNEIMVPAQIALHLNRAFLDREVAPLGVLRASPPEDTIEMLLGPTVQNPSELEARGPLDLHWISFEGARATMRVETDVRPSSVAGRVVARVPIPEPAGLHLIALSPPDDPRTVLAARVVFVGKGRDASTEGRSGSAAPARSAP